MRIMGYSMKDGAKVIDMKMPKSVTSLPGCFTHKGKHYRYYGYASADRHVYLETPCEEINGQCDSDKNENGAG
jgi:hypothetical protein